MLVWIAVAILAASFGVTTGFFMVATARRLEESGLKLNRTRRLIVRFWLYVGAVCDFAYNVTVGTVRFRELPREVMYSGRIQRLVREAEGPKLLMALKEAQMLNTAWPGHIDIPGH